MDWTRNAGTDSPRDGTSQASPGRGPHQGELALWAVAAAVAALLPAIWLWEFTVDDALIAVRYARHLASGVGYRFNVDGPATDGVTPLPWPFLLSPLARGTPLEVLDRAKLLGLIAWTAVAAAWGAWVGRAEAPRWVKAVAIGVLGLSVPVAAHAVSGMETAVALALCTVASTLGARPLAAAALAGAATSFRPELTPWALALGLGFVWAAPDRPVPRRLAWAGLLAVGPFLLVTLVRWLAFGHAAPLALSAKPSDVTHGAVYVAAGSVAALGPIVAFAPLAMLRASRCARVLAGAGFVHLAVVALVGGDWMPYARLLAPVVPSLLGAFVLSSAHARSVATALRASAAIATGIFFMFVRAPGARHVGADRRALVAEASPWLTNITRVAVLDVGWTSAASEAHVIDLAGLTDPEVAAMPGGHTSKRIDAAWLLGARPDVVLFYVSRGAPLATWQDAEFTRVVEARLASSELFLAHFVARAFLPLGSTGAGYFVLQPGSER